MVNLRKSQILINNFSFPQWYMHRLIFCDRISVDSMRPTYHTAAGTHNRSKIWTTFLLSAMVYALASNIVTGFRSFPCALPIIQRPGPTNTREVGEPTKIPEFDQHFFFPQWYMHELQFLWQDFSRICAPYLSYPGRTSQVAPRLTFPSRFPPNSMFSKLSASPKILSKIPVSATVYASTHFL